MLQDHKCGYKSLRLVFEFRHQSWFTQKVYDTLSDYGAAICIADSLKYPRKEIITSDFVYIRYHGPSQLFASSYSTKQLQEEAKMIKSLARKGLDIYAFFNNDAKGHAIQNAMVLKKLLTKK